jgi:hypothetical protein
VAEVLALSCSDPPGEVTHWTGRAVAKAVGISLRAVRRIWDQHRFQPHRPRTFKRSKDPAFAAKVEDIVGLYMSPPHHAMVEKSQIQALDRTQPGLPLKPGKCATMTHDYKIPRDHHPVRRADRPATERRQCRAQRLAAGRDAFCRDLALIRPAANDCNPRLGLACSTERIVTTGEIEDAQGA